MSTAHAASTITIFEPVSTAKALRIFPENLQMPATYPASLAGIITPNNHELIALHTYAYEKGLFDTPSWFAVIDALGIPSTGLRVPLAMLAGSELVDAGIPQQAVKLLPFFENLLSGDDFKSPYELTQSLAASSTLRTLSSPLDNDCLQAWIKGWIKEVGI